MVMKKVLLLILLNCAFITITKSQNEIQAPNPSFETWINDGGVQNPEGWKTLNPLSLLGAPITVKKSADAQSGTYSAQLKTENFGLVGNIAGLLYLGTFDALQGLNAVKLGVPFNGGTPQKLTGFYKYTSIQNDSAIIYVQLLKFNNNKRDTLADATFVEYNTTQGTDYKPFEVNFNYLIPNQTPDSIVFVITSSGGGQQGQGNTGSTLWVDNLQFVYPPNAAPYPLNPALNTVIQTFPIPANQFLTLQINNSNLLNNNILQINIFDIQQKQVFCQSLTQQKCTLNISHLPAGMYFYTLQNPVSKQIIYQNKFCIAHP